MISDFIIGKVERGDGRMSQFKPGASMALSYGSDHNTATMTDLNKIFSQTNKSQNPYGDRGIQPSMNR